MSWLSTLAPDWSQALAFLADNALKGAVVIAIAAVVAWMLRRNTAAVRHSVWSAAIAAQLVIPVLSAVLPTWRVPVIPQPAWIAPTEPALSAPNDGIASAPVTPVVTEQVQQTPAENAPANTTETGTLTAARRWNLSPIVVLAGLWLLGCVAVLVRLALGTATVSRMAIRGQRVTDEKWLGLLHRLAVTLNISRPLTLLRGDALGVPVTWGIVYPIVLLPDDADAWPEERRRYVLVHEMAHVKRLDAFTQLIAQFSLAIFWFNPLVWVAAQQMRRERENACDDYVLTHGTKPSEYATDLLQLVQDIDTEGHRAAAPAFAALAMARRSEFEGRMLSILNPRIRRTGLGRKGVVMGLLSTLIIAAPLAAFSPFSTSQPRPLSDTATLDDSVSFVEGAPSPSLVNPGAAQTPPKSGSQITESTGYAESCDRVGNFSGTSTNIHDSNERPNERNIRFVQRKTDRCIEANLYGVVNFSADERDIAELGRGARVRLREVRGGTDREVIITSVDGQQRRDYTVNGRSAAMDEEGRSWLASMIVTVMRESAYNAPERVRRLDREGGANRVLREIDAITSSGAKRDYYEALLGLGRVLDDSMLVRILGRMKREFASSSGDMRSVLEKVPVRSVRSSQVRSALTDALISIESDGDKASLLIELVPTADRALLVQIMDVAITISSDGDKSNLLIVGAASYLNPVDPELRSSYFNVARTVSSDGDLARVLINAAPFGHQDSKVTEAVIDASLRIGSDGDKANVLTYIATQKLLTSTRVKEAFTSAAMNIGSDGDRARVLRAAMINQ
jgi:beta-lactamase regulating signal transducer with metallopeptidase domain